MVNRYLLGIDIVEIDIPNVSPIVDMISIEVVSPSGGLGQSYVISGTIFLATVSKI